MNVKALLTISECHQNPVKTAIFADLRSWAVYEDHVPS